MLLRLPRFSPALLAALLLAVVLGGSGCTTLEKKPTPVAVAPVAVTPAPAESQIKPEWLRPPTTPFTLGPGDRVDIEVVGDPKSRESEVVGPDGKIYFQVLPGLDVWGLTPTEAAKQLEASLGKLYREPPRVTVTLRAIGSKQVWLLGRLTLPGIYPLTGPTTLLEAISRAGGPGATPSATALAVSAAFAPAGGSATAMAGSNDDAADLDRAFVMRRGALLPVNFTRLLRNGDMAQNIYLEPDDLVYLPSAVAPEVYVLGAVAAPKAVGFTNRTTLVAAVAAAGGTEKDAYLSHVAVVRGGWNEPQITIVDYNEIVHGRAPDVPLEARDIVYVPLTPYHTLTRYLDLILSTFARTVGVNAGARAVSRGQSIGISVPVGPGP